LGFSFGGKKGLFFFLKKFFVGVSAYGKFYFIKKFKIFLTPPTFFGDTLFFLAFPGLAVRGFKILPPTLRKTQPVFTRGWGGPLFGGFLGCREQTPKKKSKKNGVFLIFYQGKFFRGGRPQILMFKGGGGAFLFKGGGKKVLNLKKGI